MKNNGSIYIHSFIVLNGMSPDPAAGKGVYSRKWTIYQSHRINKYKKIIKKKTKNLLTGETDDPTTDAEVSQLFCTN